MSDLKRNKDWIGFFVNGWFANNDNEIEKIASKAAHYRRETEMALEIEPIHPLFVGQASGIDLSGPLSDAEVIAIEQAMDRYAVLVFRDQPLTPAQQIAFAKAMGPLDLGFTRLKRLSRQAAHRFQYEELADISNTMVDGAVVDRDHRKIISNLGNQLWHSDSSFQDPSARYSMLACVTTPSWGGETQFADLRAACDALDERTRRLIEGLEAEHYALHSRLALGDTSYSEAERAAIPAAQWPLLRRHAGSGRDVLFIGAHASHIVGMSVAEGRVLLWDLLEHATQREFVHTHVWQPNDLVIWDNRCTLHRGRRYDFAEPRELRRATTIDAPHEMDQEAVA